MSRLSQDREEREAQLREYSQDLRGTTTYEPPATKRDDGVTIGQILLGIVAVVVVVKALPWILGLLLGTLSWLVIWAVRLVVLAGIGYAVWYFLVRKKKR